MRWEKGLFCTLFLVLPITADQILKKFEFHHGNTNSLSTMKKFCYTHLLNSKNSLRLGTYYQNNFVLFKNTLENSRLLTTSPIIQNDNQDEYNEILKTYQIPGRYLHYFKKSKRQLKKEAHEASRFGDEVCIVIHLILI